MIIDIIIMIIDNIIVTNNHHYHYLYCALFKLMNTKKKCDSKAI